jgi:hypothetical protein
MQSRVGVVVRPVVACCNHVDGVTGSTHRRYVASNKIASSISSETRKRCRYDADLLGAMNRTLAVAPWP